MKPPACLQPEAFLRAPLSQYQEHLRTKTIRKTGHVGRTHAFVPLNHVASYSERRHTSPNMERTAGLCWAAPFWHEAKQERTTNQKKAPIRIEPKTLGFVAFLSWVPVGYVTAQGALYPVPV